MKTAQFKRVEFVDVINAGWRQVGEAREWPDKYKWIVKKFRANEKHYIAPDEYRAWQGAATMGSPRFYVVKDDELVSALTSWNDTKKILDRLIAP